MAKRTARIIGSTGLVGSHLIQQILQSDKYSKLTVISRRPLDKDNLKIKN